MQIYDFMMRLPHNLCFRIADYLYFEDLLRVRLVSRSWYQAFCKADISAYAIQKQTSLPLEQFFQRFGVNYAKLDDKMKDECHRKYMINRIRREHGIASSIFELQYDLNDFLQFRYSEGRVVIIFRDNIIVEDLKTRKKSLFQYPRTANRRWTGRPWLDGQFLISLFLIKGRNGHLVIWNVISRHRYLIPIDLCIYDATSYQNQVGLVFTDFKYFQQTLFFFTWNEESGLQRLMTIQKHEDQNQKIVFAQISFHPSKKGVVFITIQTRMLTMYDSSTYGTKITVGNFHFIYFSQTVYCYENSQLVSTQQEVIKTRTLPAENVIQKYSNENQICFYAREPPFRWIEPGFEPHVFVKLSSVVNQGPEDLWQPIPRDLYRSALHQEPSRYDENVPAENHPSTVREESYVRWIKRPEGYVPLAQPRISSDETFYEHLIYDMSTRQFNRFKIPLHLTYQESLFGHGSLIWNDQVLIRACHENIEKLQVITLSKRLSGVWNGSVGKDDSSHSSRSSITRSENRLSCRSSPFKCQDGLQDNPNIEVYGDDNFVVLKADGRIKVWKFDEFKATIRKTGSRKVDCQWRANLKLTNVGWEFEVDSSAQHNHAPSESQLTHPILQRPSKIDAKQILTTLREQGVKILDRDVWNERQKWRTETLNGLSPSEALLEALENYGLNSGEKYQFEVETLTVDDKELALKNALTRVFPILTQLLCRWHISKNLQAKAAAIFSVSNSSTEEEKEHKNTQRDLFMIKWNTIANA
ncbi:hypothetical protein EPUL_004611, partial [Erysiphe pulchra]